MIKIHLSKQSRLASETLNMKLKINKNLWFFTKISKSWKKKTIDDFMKIVIYSTQVS